jgi:GMP synthase PP-ATPase subunit
MQHINCFRAFKNEHAAFVENRRVSVRAGQRVFDALVCLRAHQSSDLVILSVHYWLVYVQFMVMSTSFNVTDVTDPGGQK